VKTQKDITESESKKWFDLTPVKHGYTPERHPTKKKAKKSMRNPPRQPDIQVITWKLSTTCIRQSWSTCLFSKTWWTQWEWKATDSFQILYVWFFFLFCFVFCLTYPMIINWLKQQSYGSTENLTEC